MNNKVSVIIPAYNNGEYIGEALDSVIVQTYPYWECIVVDDGSTDNTREIVAGYCQKDPRITYLYQENSGPSVARNNGIAHTSGEFILPLDADDKIADTYLEKAVSHFLKHPETTLVYCKASYFGDRTDEWTLREYNYSNFIYANCIFVSALYKRSDYNNTPGYNPTMINGLEDWDFWLSLLDSKSIVYRLNEILFFYRSKPMSRNDTCEKNHLSNVYLQILTNHIHLYNIEVFFRDNLKQNNELNTKAYKIGKLILFPFACIQNILDKTAKIWRNFNLL